MSLSNSNMFTYTKSNSLHCLLFSLSAKAGILKFLKQLNISKATQHSCDFVVSSRKNDMFLMFLTFL